MAIEIVIGEIDARLRPVEAQARWIGTRVRDGRLHVRDEDPGKLSVFFDAALSATPQVTSAALMTPDGGMRQWHRDDGFLPPEDWSDDQGFVDWVSAGEKMQDLNWGPPFWLDLLNSVVIVLEMPLFDDQGYFGFLALAVSISDLSKQISRIDEHTFILAGRDNVLAHPLMIDWRPLDTDALPSAAAIYEGRSALMPLEELGDPVLERLWTADFKELVLIPKHADVRAVSAIVGDNQYVYLYREIKGYGPDPWTVGLYVDVATASASGIIHRLNWAAAAGGGVLVIAVGLCLFLTKAITRPVRALADASRAVRDGRFDDVPKLPTSHIGELESALSSFEAMVSGLAEREVIKRTLGRYVPEKIAETLLKGDGGLEPTEADATILFADVAGFTALTQALGPTRIVEVLNAYFSRMTDIIERHGGVITQFQGDAILAIFNVPIPAADHADKACQAAIEMCAAVKNEHFAGQEISARIGLNTGPVVAGAVGAEGRLTYTVHGDAVNRAARVEALNKQTGTTLLLTEETSRLVKDIPIEKVATMPVRGQTIPVTVFTVSDTGASPSKSDPGPAAAPPDR